MNTEMTMAFLFASTIIFMLLAFIWNYKDGLNLILKMFWIGMAIWGLTLSLNYYYTDTLRVLKSEQEKLQQLMKARTNQVNSINSVTNKP